MERRTDSGLTVRRFERHDLRLPARPRLADATAGAGRGSAEAGAGEGFYATVIDAGEGGLGFWTRLYLPRTAVLRVVVPGLDDASAHPLLEAEVRVMRTRMVDRGPTYEVGTAFVDPTPVIGQSVADLLALRPSPGGA